MVACRVVANSLGLRFIIFFFLSSSSSYSSIITTTQQQHDIFFIINYCLSSSSNGGRRWKNTCFYLLFYFGGHSPTSSLFIGSSSIKKIKKPEQKYTDYLSFYHIYYYVLCLHLVNYQFFFINYCNIFYTQHTIHRVTLLHNIITIL